VLIEPAFGSLLPNSAPGLEQELASRKAMLTALTNYVETGRDERAAITLIDWVQGGGDGFDRMPRRVRKGLLANAKTIGPTFSVSPPHVTCDQLKHLQVPTLVVNGKRTRLFYRLIGRTVAECIPSAESAVIPGTGHMTIVEDSAWNAQVLLEFLERH
jgi:pimeloyl-ACP methyl ester carboxylesterase